MMWPVAKLLERQAQPMLFMRGLGGPITVQAKSGATGADDARVEPHIAKALQRTSGADACSL